AVVDFDIVAIGAETRSAADNTVTGGIDGGSGRGGEIDAFVHFGIAQNRVAAHPKARGHTRSVDGSADQAAAVAGAVGLVVIDVSGAVFVAIDRVFLAAEGQAGIGHFA